MGNKYRARRTTVDGITFASKREANRYGELLLLQRAGKIAELRLQPKFPLRVNGESICTYIADFQYEDRATGRSVVEDAKGIKTPVYRLKKKLLFACYGITIHEV